MDNKQGMEGFGKTKKIEAKWLQNKALMGYRLEKAEDLEKEVINILNEAGLYMQVLNMTVHAYNKERFFNLDVPIIQKKLFAFTKEPERTRRIKLNDETYLDDFIFCDYLYNKMVTIRYERNSLLNENKEEKIKSPSEKKMEELIIAQNSINTKLN